MWTIILLRKSIHQQLIKRLLGPNKGINETIVGGESFNQYVVGVLATIKNSSTNDESEMFESGKKWAGNKFDGTDKKVSETDSDNEIAFDNNDLLNIKGKAKTMGIGFLVNNLVNKNHEKDEKDMDVLVTWARYKSSAIQSGFNWKRKPHYINVGLSFKDDNREEKCQCESDCNEKIRISTINLRSQISVFITNINDEEDNYNEDCIFQPQIRINILNNRLENLSRRGNSELDLLYRNKEMKARGFNCAAVWKEIDEVDYFLDEKKEAFNWVDSEVVDEKIMEGFKKPDLRTEFLPYYQITQPDFNIKDWEDIMNAEEMAEWDKDKVKDLSRVASDYGNWIDKQIDIHEDVLNGENEGAKDNVLKCKDLIKNIESGINVLKTDDDALLAFNIMNKAIDTQWKWKGNAGGFPWRGFQLVFILASLKGVLLDDVKEREICDLLWFPTGSGKTESYLGLLSLCLVYKKLKLKRKFLDSNIPEVDGTSVFSRYTLRLLTIQQFRRTTSIITALETIRTDGPEGLPKWVKNLKDKSHIEENLFRSGKFSIGLWVGDGVTPNWLNDEYSSAIQKLERDYSDPNSTSKKDDKTEGEPAQILDCPVCSSILAVTNTTFSNTPKKLHWIVEGCSKKPDFTGWKKINETRYSITNQPVVDHSEHMKDGVFTISIEIEPKQDQVFEEKDVFDVWDRNFSYLGDVVCARPSRPGYFVFLKEGNTNDFQIHCPNPKCKLNELGDKSWNERILDYVPESPEVFKKQDSNELWSIPITAYTVDEQIYDKCPNIIIATVDKFAILAHNPKGGTIFGNIDAHCTQKNRFVRFDCEKKVFKKKPNPKAVAHSKCSYCVQISVDSVSLVIQDELHLLDGPLGSTVGLYETFFDLLCTNKKGRKPKYISSTATINESIRQIRSLFDRESRVFPPPLFDIDDNYFSRADGGYKIDSAKQGRLYVGVDSFAAGSMQTLTRNTWATLLQEPENERNRLIRGGGTSADQVDPFWTMVAYFNARNELSLASSVYSGEVVEEVNSICDDDGITDKREIREEGTIQLWADTPSEDLPGYLDRIKTKSHGLRNMNDIDVIFCTSMFGTGIDIDRLALMSVSGQPKTTSNYIQATGRIGRQTGGLVLTMLNGRKPRDKNQFEFFTGYHHALHYYVEPVTVYPFAERCMEIGLGPAIVLFIRNARRVQDASGKMLQIDCNWAENPKHMEKYNDHSSSVKNQVDAIIDKIVQRANNQPKGRKSLKPRFYKDEVVKLIDEWINCSKKPEKFVYNDWSALHKVPTQNVVLGLPQHENAEVSVVYHNAPTSLRNTEETTAFGVLEDYY